MMSVKGHIVDVISHEIFDGELVIDGETIVEVKRCELPESKTPWPYLMPGFIDSHVHIESSMMTPREFGRLVVAHGTVGVIADPHEIGNVLGVEGIDFMIRSSRQVRFNFCFGAPSCVPSIGGEIETCGAVLDAKDTEKLMARPDIGFLGEMMNYQGVLAGDKEVMAKIEAALRHGKPVDGHAPGLTGNQRNKYASAGISTDHECSTLEEGRSCISAGMKVIIREGSAAKDYELLKDLIGESPNMVMLCSDDCHPDDLVRGHINQIVKRALADGYDLWSVLQVACVNAQRHYRQKWGLLQAGDPATFIVVNNLSSHFRVQHTFIRGTEVFSYNGNISHNAIFTSNEGEMELPNRFEAEPITVEDLNMDMKTGDTVHVILASDGSLLTKHEVEKLTGNPLKDARYPWSEVQKMVVYNRYEPGAKPIVGLVRGFGIKSGAIAGTVAHDCHNIVAIGSDDEYLVRAINRIVEMRGGQVVITPEDMLDIPLPIAGLMAPFSGQETAILTISMHEIVKRTGCQMKSPFITMAFMCLPVIPDIKLTDRHLMDTKTMSVIY
jgi:adenine deaminase